MDLRLADFDYPLPAELIAQQPAPRRDGSRLMVLGRPDGALRHSRFRRLPKLLRGGDLLVLNDTQVVPARFVARRATGGRIEGLFVRQADPGLWEVMLRNARNCRPGQALALEPGGLQLTLQDNLGQGRWLVRPGDDRPAPEVLAQFGQIPLPPYIRRSPAPRDRRRYQTVYAAVPGAVAAPTAGLHFTPGLLERLHTAGIQTCRLTLHVGPGTFLPVKADRVADHRMHAEWFSLGAKTADALNAARARGRRIIAVGTTSLRVLETLARRPKAAGAERSEFRPQSGWTDVFIYPPACFHAADALITNFHLPRSTLLMLVAAFCSPGRTEGLPMILDAYAQAVRLGYRFFSYGDAMLIE